MRRIVLRSLTSSCFAGRGVHFLRVHPSSVDGLLKTPVHGDAKSQLVVANPRRHRVKLYLKQPNDLPARKRAHELPPNPTVNDDPHLADFKIHGRFAKLTRVLAGNTFSFRR